MTQMQLRDRLVAIQQRLDRCHRQTRYPVDLLPQNFSVVVDGIATLLSLLERSIDEERSAAADVAHTLAAADRPIV